MVVDIQDDWYWDDPRAACVYVNGREYRAISRYVPESKSLYRHTYSVGNLLIVISTIENTDVFFIAECEQHKPLTPLILLKNNVEKVFDGVEKLNEVADWRESSFLLWEKEHTMHEIADYYLSFNFICEHAFGTRISAPKKYIAYIDSVLNEILEEEGGLGIVNFGARSRKQAGSVKIARKRKIAKQSRKQRRR
jgi:hypothetical protein